MRCPSVSYPPPPSSSPGTGQVLKGSLWCGQRPVSADGVPIVSPVSEAASNLWVNGGQGSMGFKFSCGSAQILAWLVSEVRVCI